MLAAMTHALPALLGQVSQPGFQAPAINWVAFSPLIVVTVTLVLVLVIDFFTERYDKGTISTIAGFGLLVALLFVAIVVATDNTASMFGGAFVIDNFALVLQGLFLLSGYVVILISTNYIAEGDYWEGEYYQLLLAAILGMMLMAASRDLISIFISLELLSIPAYLLAAWRKRDLKSDEAGMKYYLMGVFATAVMLYGMSLIYGLTGSTLLTDINKSLSGPTPNAVVILGIIFVLVGFGFKVSAVPFHQWAPDTYEGAPTPITAFLAVGSKAAGFVALLNLIFVGFLGRTDIVEPLMFALSALTMIVGNLIALRQSNVVRMLAYSGVAQAGYMLAPLAVIASEPNANTSMRSIITYLMIYAAMNLGAFACVIALARKTRSAEIDSFRGAFYYAPGLAWSLTFFLASLAGIPPFGGWFAKFSIFQALFGVGTNANGSTNWSGYVLGLWLVINSVIAAFYYMRVVRVMAFEPEEGVDMSPVSVPSSLSVAIGITVVITVLTGIVPAVVSHFAASATLVGLGG
jgi:NADH-quinone oxidoreductase subunit N